MKFTTKAQFSLEPGVTALDLATGGQAHVTDAAWQPSLGDLAHIPYRRAKFRYKLAKNQVSTAGQATLSIKAGSVEKASVVIDLTSSQNHQGVVDLDLAGVAGESGISVTLTVDAAADASTTGDLYAAVDFEVPLIVSSC